MSIKTSKELADLIVESIKDEVKIVKIDGYSSVLFDTDLKPSINILDEETNKLKYTITITEY